MKKVLFIPVGMYDYDSAIEAEMEKQGYDVTTFYPLPKYNMIERIYNKLTKEKYLQKKSYERQKKILKSINNRFDYVFVIVGNMLDPKLFKEFRENSPDTKFVLYLWDDISRVSNFEQMKGNFDKIISFDLENVEKYNFDFLPLFYSNSHRYQGESKKYDLCLIGSWHDERHELWNKIVKKYHLKKEKLFLFLLGSKFKHFFCWIFPNEKKYLSHKYIKLMGMKFEETAQIMKESKVALDVQFGSQSGLTMRTIESVGANTKLITTNASVRKYDFFDSRNICVIDRSRPEIDEEFWKTEYRDVPEEIVSKYSLCNWVQAIFMEK